MTDLTDRALTEAQSAAAGLRELADFIETHPRFAETLSYQRFLMPVNGATPEEFAALVRQLGGTRQKDANDSYFKVLRQFGPITFQLYTERENVCVRRKVGERVVDKPDPDAPMVEVVEDVYAWDCAPVLADAVEPV